MILELYDSVQKQDLRRKWLWLLPDETLQITFSAKPPVPPNCSAKSLLIAQLPAEGMRTPPIEFFEWYPDKSGRYVGRFQRVRLPTGGTWTRICYAETHPVPTPEWDVWKPGPAYPPKWRRFKLGPILEHRIRCSLQHGSHPADVLQRVLAWYWSGGIPDIWEKLGPKETLRTLAGVDPQRFAAFGGKAEVERRLVQMYQRQIEMNLKAAGPKKPLPT